MSTLYCFVPIVEKGGCDAMKVHGPDLTVNPHIRYFFSLEKNWTLTWTHVQLSHCNCVT